MSYTRKQQCYQEGCHGQFGNGAIYQNENLRGRTNINNRKKYNNNHYLRSSNYIKKMYKIGCQ